MFYSPAVADATSTSTVLPTFDELLVGPADVDGDAEDSTAASLYFWGARAWLPPTKHQRKG
jgi:hypothetical protein